MDPPYDIDSWNTQLFHPDPLPDCLFLSITQQNLPHVCCAIGGLGQRRRVVPKVVVHFDGGVPYILATNVLEMVWRELKPPTVIVYGFDGDASIAISKGFGGSGSGLGPDEATVKVTQLLFPPCNRPLILERAQRPGVVGLIFVNQEGLVDPFFTCEMYIDVTRLDPDIVLENASDPELFESFEDLDDELLRQIRKDGGHYIMDFNADYDPDTDGALSMKDRRFRDLLAGMCSVNNHSADRGVDLERAISKDAFHDNYTDSVVLACTIKVLERGNGLGFTFVLGEMIYRRDGGGSEEQVEVMDKIWPERQGYEPHLGERNKRRCVADTL